MIDPAGGINTSVADMAKWLQVQLPRASPPTPSSCGRPHRRSIRGRPRRSSDRATGRRRNCRPTGFAHLCAGLFVEDFRGLRSIQHSCRLSGQVTYTALLPSCGIGVSVFTNVEEAVSAPLRNAMLDRLINAPAWNWVASHRMRTKQIQDEALASMKDGIDTPTRRQKVAAAGGLRRYRDPWYGTIVMSEKGGALLIDFARTRFTKSAREDVWSGSQPTAAGSRRSR